MRPKPAGKQPLKLLTAQAEQVYGPQRVRDLAAQIKLTAAAIAAVAAYPLAPETEPWPGRSPALVQIDDSGTRT